MKTKLLKKLRKRYQLYWRKNKEILVVLDRKSLRVTEFFSIEDFLRHYVYENIGFHSGVDYHIRIITRKHTREYRKAEAEYQQLNSVRYPDPASVTKKRTLAPKV